MKKILITLMLIFMVIPLTACTNKESDALTFKETYESLNGKELYGNKTRSVEIPEDNPIKITTIENINKMTKNNQTFYVYFGFESCPWCRSIVEKMLEVAIKNKIKNIYYVDVRPGEDSSETDIRDEYAINEENEIYLERKGTEGYHEFQKLYVKVLNDYKHGDIKNLEGTKFEGEKRLGAPNIIYVKKGKPQKLVSGISEKQTDGYQKLTKEILKDETKAFEELFKN